MLFYDAPIKRDVLMKRISRNKTMIISCDSSGAIGPKNGDFLKVSGEVVGKFMVRSALMEVLATGARPICISCGLGVEPMPTGVGIIEGIKQEMKKIGMRPEEDLVISTEKNFPTEQTGLGITVIGIASRGEMRIGKSKRGDLVVSVGVPSVGAEVLRNEVADLEDMLSLLSMDFVHGVIPVGSKGIIYESKVLAMESKLKADFFDDIGIDVGKSAGPSTVILAAIEERCFELLKEKIKKPLHKIGKLI